MLRRKSIICIILSLGVLLTACKSAQPAVLPELPTPAPTPQVSVSDLIADALRHYEAGDYEEAILLYLGAIEIEPRNFNANLGLGKSYRGLGKNEEAISVLQTAYEIDSGSTEAMQELHGTYDVMYNEQLVELASTNGSNAERKQIFEDWLTHRYAAYEAREKVFVDEDEIRVLEDLEEITREMEYCDLDSLQDKDLFSAVIDFYLNPYRQDGWYGFKYQKFDDTHDEISLVDKETIQELLFNLFKRNLQDPDNSPSSGDPCIDGIYRMGVGDSGEATITFSACYYLDENTWYVIFDGYDPAAEETTSNVTGMVICLAEDSAFGFNVIARRGFYWG